MVTKLYCYVDETGQDTRGKMFIVVSIVVDDERDKILDFLENAELQSGKTKRKWIKTRLAEREKYLEIILNPAQFEQRIYYQIFSDSIEYEDLMVLVIAKSINLYSESHELSDYKITVVIDGLKQTEAKRIAKSLRQLGVTIRKVRGERDESNALLRFSDAMAGLIREATEGKEEYLKILKKAKKNKITYELNP